MLVDDIGKRTLVIGVDWQKARLLFVPMSVGWVIAAVICFVAGRSAGGWLSLAGAALFYGVGLPAWRRRPSRTRAPSEPGDASTDEAQAGCAIGHYPPLMVDVIFRLITAASCIAIGSWTRRTSDSLAVSVWAGVLVVAGGLGVLAALFLPGTVVTRTGFRRGRFLRFTPWSKVVEVYPPPAGGFVQVRLMNDKIVMLDGVTTDRVAGIVALARGLVQA